MSRSWRAAALALAAALLAAWGAPMARGQERPNIVVIVGDDHGTELGCYGNRVIRTPNLDALAAEGTRFEYAFCTTASCSPSRAVLLSGLHSHANGQYGLQHAEHKQSAHPWVKGLPNLLRAAGYRSACVGKYHVAPESSFHFDDYITGGGRNPMRMAELAEAWIRKEDTRPFFLYFCFNDPHRAGRGFGNDREYPGVREVTYDPAAIPVPGFLPDRPEVRQELAGYYQAISRLDQGVGRLMQALRETGRLRNTLVLYTGDHGMPFPGAKTSMYEPGLRVPLIVRLPNARRRGIVSRAMVTLADVTPTLLEFAGARGPDYPLHGRSFLKVVEETDPPGWDEIFASHQFHEITMYYPMRTVRTRRFKLILNLAHPLPVPFASDLWGSETWQGVLRRGDRTYGARTLEAFLHRPRFELYDLESDPLETKNLADDPRYADTLKELQAKLRAWQEKTGDPWRVKYIHE